MKIVASLTTMPKRIDLIRGMLDSITNQSLKVDHIEINIPYKCVRTGEDYVIPEWLESYPGLQIFRTEDYGAITKIAPTLLRYKDDAETYLWSVDDDINYDSRLLDSIIRHHDPSLKRVLANSVATIDSNGFHGCPGQNKNGMILEGFGTVLYPPKCVEDDFLSYVERTSAIPDCKLSDDVVLSNYIHGKGMLIFCCSKPYINHHFNTFSYFKDADATHLQSGGHVNRYIRVIYHLKDLGLLYWKKQFPRNNNIMTMKTRPPQPQPTNHPLPVVKPVEKPLHRIFLKKPLSSKAPIITTVKNEPNNFALSCSSQKAGKRFWG